jgi:hypothetical protein
MKILFDHCQLWDDAQCKLGLDWSSFDPVVGSKLPGSGGFRVSFFLVRWYVVITWVKDFKSYKARQDYRRFKKDKK